MQLNIESTSGGWQDKYLQLLDPTAVDADILRPCYPNESSGDCFTYVYAPDTAFAGEIAGEVAILAAAGSGAEVAEYTYTAFDDGDAIDAWIISNPNTTALAFIVHDDGEVTGTVSCKWYLMIDECNVKCSAHLTSPHLTDHNNHNHNHTNTYRHPAGKRDPHLRSLWISPLLRPDV
jgi:hypothetical protein